MTTMRSLFSGFYRPDDDAFETLWREATFVLDANVLLNLYRYPRKTRDELIGVFTKLADRLWVPYQAALEYQRNRLTVIAQQKKKFDEVRLEIGSILSKLSSLNEKLKNRHSLIDLSKLIAALDDPVNSYLEELKVLEKDQLDVFDLDPIRDHISELFADRVGQSPNQLHIDDVNEKLKQRYSNNIPPGFEDDNKGEITYSYNNLIYRAKAGDLLMWYQIMEFAKEGKLKNILFINDEKKKDWWEKIDSKGDKLIGPRPELISEIREVSGVENFYMYGSLTFVEHASKYLGIGVSNEFIKRIKEVTATKPIQYDVNVQAFAPIVQMRLALDNALARLAERANINSSNLSYRKLRRALFNARLIDQDVLKRLDETIDAFHDLIRSPEGSTNKEAAANFYALTNEVIEQVNTAANVFSGYTFHEHESDDEIIQ